jgi:beta-aspartyl-peptidase (threonine type)
MKHRDLIKRSLFSLIACSFLWLCVWMIQLKDDAFAQADPARTARAAIKQVLDDQVAAWNKGDLKGFMVGYWNSPELTFFSGKDKQRGWEATYERYRKRYQAEGREMGKLSFNELQIEMLGSEGAFVRGKFNLVTSKETFTGLFTLIFKKLPDGWRIIHDHTSA